MIKSKYRPEYWIMQFSIIIIILIFLGFWIYITIENDKPDFENPEHWILILSVILFTVYIIKFISTGFRQIILDNDKIIIKYLISKRTSTIYYEDIKKMNLNREQTTLDGTTLTDGYHKLKIELYNGNSFEFDEYEYANFTEIKAEINKYRVKKSKL